MQRSRVWFYMTLLVAGVHALACSAAGRCESLKPTPTPAVEVYR